MPKYSDKGAPWDGRLASVQTLLKLATNGAYLRHWYRDANADLHRLAPALGVSVDTLADVLAVTSPRVHVSRNVRLAVAAIRGGAPALADAGAMSATRAAFDKWRDTGRIDGPKTAAFSAALKGDLTAVVLDVWVARALAPTRAVQLAPERLQSAAFNRTGTRAECIRRIEEVARVLEWAPAEAQAAVWAGAYTRHFPGVPRAPSFDILANALPHL